MPDGPKRKNQVMKNKKRKYHPLLILLVLVMLISFLLSFRPVAERVGKVTGQAADVIVDWAKVIFLFALGLWLISTGVAALAVPALGVALILIGLGLVAVAIIPKFWGSWLPSAGQKPDPVKV